ncbi:hypothetical protein LLG95_01905 [bacterium]|nr:hypothetical protein [bacterium]
MFNLVMTNRPVTSLARYAALLIALALSAAVLIMQARDINWGIWLIRDVGGPWRGDWHFPTESLFALAAGAAVLFTITGIGLTIIHFLSPRRRIFAPIETLVLSPLIGAVPVSLLALAVGLAGLASRANMRALLVFLFVSSAAGWGLWFHRRRPGPKRTISSLQLFSIVLILIVFALAIPYALSPVVQSDALRYHVAAPAEWLRDGRIHYLPHQAFSNFPFLGEMLFMLAMAAGGYEAAQVVHFGMLPVSMSLIFLLALRWMRWSGIRKSPGHALAAAAAFAASPSVAILAGWAFIDLFVVAYFLAFTLVGAASLARPGRRRCVILGFMIAGALSVKYTMLALIGLLGLIWFALNLKSSIVNRQSSIARALLAGLLGLALASPWYLRNAAWTGNPVYPLAIKHFDGGDWTAAEEKFYMEKAGEKGFKISSWPRPIAAPVEFLASPYQATFRPDLFENHILGPLPLIALLVALAGSLSLRTQHSGLRTQWFLYLVLVISWVFWFATYQSSRMLFPTIAILLAWAAVACAGWERAGTAAMLAIRAVAGAAILLSLALYVTFMLMPNGRGSSNADALATALGFQKRDVYLAHTLPYWQSAHWLSRHAAPGEKALLIGEYRPLYFDLPIVVSDFFDTPQPVPWFRRAPTNDAMLDLLLANNVRYIFYNRYELNQYYKMYFVPRLQPGQIRRFEALLPTGNETRADLRLVPIDSHGTPPNDMILYRIR